jgi:copper chaperone
MIAFVVSDMTTTRCAGAIKKAIQAVDRAAEVHIDLESYMVEIEPRQASARQLSDAILRAGYTPEAA